jgi:hypothetical protein
VDTGVHSGDAKGRHKIESCLFEQRGRSGVERHLGI